MYSFNSFALFLVLILFGTRGIASFTTKDLGNIQIHIGNWLEYPGQVRASKQGATNGFDFSPYFATSLEYNFKEKIQFIPELGYIFQKINDKIDKNQFFARLDLSYAVYEFLKLRVGSSFMVLNLSSDGSEEKLQNGNSSQVYYRPSESHTIFNQTLDFGMEYLFQQHSIKIQSYTYAWNQEKERLTSFSLAYTYAISLDTLL